MSRNKNDDDARLTVKEDETTLFKSNIFCAGKYFCQPSLKETSLSIFCKINDFSANTKMQMQTQLK